MSKPFIIWTFRRCGGTNLAEALFKSSEFKAIQHEPFNNDRIFGAVTKAFRESGDESAMRADVEERLNENILIKHCLEIIPEEINTSLATISTLLGYRHLFLYREEPTQRILSLNYAMKTQIWGRDQIKEVPDSIFQQEINIDGFINHELHCRREMGRIYELLNSMGADVMSVSFEMLYKSPFEYSSQVVKDIFRALEVEKEILTPEFLKKTLTGGGQKTNSQYMRFVNSTDFKNKLDKVDSFTLYPINLTEPTIEFVSNDLIHLEVWAPYASIKNNEKMVMGVILAKDGSQNFKIKSKNYECDLIAKIDSPRISKIYPDVAASAKSRFLLSLPKNTNEIKLLASDGTVLSKVRFG